jgi:hypothetical protein
MKIVFIADFFANQVLGGGELNNEELITMLRNDQHDVVKLNSHNVGVKNIEEYKNRKFIIANFVNLTKEVIYSLYDKKYIIYEHDHKYLTTRNPASFANFKAPKEYLVNLEFYKNAQAVLCQSQFHLDIIKLNTGLNNLINLSGNIWSIDSLNLMNSACENTKLDTYAIMDSPILHKNTGDAIKYCKVKNLLYNLIPNCDYKTFLNSLSKNKALVFFPKTPETLSRVVVEARMMNMGVIGNNLIGASRESWYNLKGVDLIETMRNKRHEIKAITIKALT